MTDRTESPGGGEVGYGRPPEHTRFRKGRSGNPKGPGDLVVQSWDTASKAEEIHDYSACTTWLSTGSGEYLIDVFRRRLEYPELRRRVVGLARAHRADAVLIEDEGSGTHLIQELRHEGRVRPIAIRPEGDKVTRMAAHSARIEAGGVLLPERAPWLGDFQTEILQFPQGRFDDQVDSLAQFLSWRDERRYAPRWLPIRPRKDEEPPFIPVSGGGRGDGWFRLR